MRVRVSSAMYCRAQADVIDLSPLANTNRRGQGKTRIVQQVKRAITKREHSAFYAKIDVLVPAGQVRRAYDHLATFHNLPSEVKQKYHSTLSPINRGWVPLFEEPVYDAGKVSYVEAFDFGIEIPEYCSSQPGIGPNVWPEEIPHFEEDVYGLYNSLSNVSDGLFSVFEDICEVPKNTFKRHSTSMARSVMRLLRYPGAGDQVINKGDVGISAHTDFECFTLIHQNAPGLQVLDSVGNWVDMDPLDVNTNTEEIICVVLVGDMIERWTNGWIRATPHRVLRTPDERMSLIRFNGLDNNAIVEPISKFISEDSPARYAPITQGQHLNAAAESADSNMKDLLEQGVIPPSKYAPGTQKKTL